MRLRVDFKRVVALRGPSGLLLFGTGRNMEVFLAGAGFRFLIGVYFAKKRISTNRVAWSFRNNAVHGEVS